MDVACIEETDEIEASDCPDGIRLAVRRAGKPAVILHFRSRLDLDRIVNAIECYDYEEVSGCEATPIT